MGAGVEAVPGIRAVQRLGVRVAATDRDPDAPGMGVADEALVASTYDVDATLRAAREVHARTPLAGVLCIATDVPLTVARVAQALGLPGIPVETAKLAADKLAMKRALERGGVPVPWYAPLETHEHLAAVAAERGETLVVKPADSRGSRGVQRLVPETTGAGFERAFERAAEASPSQRVLVESFVEGPQLSTESVVVDGRVHTCAFSDRNYEFLERYAPWVIENGGDFPSRHREREAGRVDRVLEDAARALGLERGVLKGDLVLDPVRGPVVIEVATRLSGGTLSTWQVPASTGVPLVELAARLAMGETPARKELEPRRWDPLSIRYFFPPAGRLRDVRGFEEVRQRPEVVVAELHVRPGDELRPVTDHTRRAGFVLVRGSSREDARERAGDAVRSVEFDVDATP